MMTYDIYDDTVYHKNNLCCGLQKIATCAQVFNEYRKRNRILSVIEKCPCYLVNIGIAVNAMKLSFTGRTTVTSSEGASDDKRITLLYSLEKFYCCHFRSSIVRCKASVSLSPISWTVAKSTSQTGVTMKPPAGTKYGRTPTSAHFFMKQSKVANL
jgi:hypothetical protein